MKSQLTWFFQSDVFLLWISFFKSRYFSYFLAFLIFFQTAFAFPQTQSLLPHPIKVYDSGVPLHIKAGSFSLASGEYNSPPIPDQDYIADSQLGYAIRNLFIMNIVESEIYTLHNGLVSQLNDIQDEQGENTQKHLEEMISRRRIPRYSIPGVGMAKLTQIDKKFFIRILHEPTEIAFYVLDEQKLSADSDHLKQLEARQHFVAGTGRQDGQKGRDVILLWRNGPTNTRTVVSPRIQKNPNENQQILPRFQEPRTFRRMSREHRRLHRMDYWNALKKPLDWNALSFGIALALFQGGLVTGGVGLFQEWVSGREFNILPAMCITGSFSVLLCSFASIYRYWINMGGRGFIQRKEHAGWGTGWLEQVKDIDWGATLRSKTARASLVTLLFSWSFLYLTDPRVEDIDSLMGFFEFLLMAQLIAIPNLLLNKVSKVTWMEQATLNELAGRTNRDVTFHIPFFPPFSWSLKNLDHFVLRYFFYRLASLFHLTGVQLPSALVSGASSYGINLNALGINSGLFAMYFMLLLGKFLTLRMVFKLHYRNLLSDREAWSYLDSMTRERTTGLFLNIDSMYRRILSWWHRVHIPSEVREDLQKALFSDASPLENLPSSTAHHFEQWRMHEEIYAAQQQERTLHSDRQRIGQFLGRLEPSFIQYFIANAGEHLLSNNLRDQTRTSFRNFGKVLHALSETLKTYILQRTSSTSHQTSSYAQIWERNRNSELEDILNFFKQHLTEEFPHLRQALNVITNQIQAEAIQDVERLQDIDVLETLLQEFSDFIQVNVDKFKSYVDEQELIGITHRSGGVLQNTKKPHTVQLDLSFIDSVKNINICRDAVSH